MQLQVVFLCLGLAFAATGCAKVKAAVCVDMVPAPKASAAGGPAAKPADPKAAKSEEHAAEAPQTEAAPVTTANVGSTSQEQFALPFAWEKSPNEPLSRTRAYLRDMARDNAQYMRRGPEYFKAFANAETPRATVLTCADSRVQPAAFDATADNDDYTVRNLGNQLVNSLGAVQYGIDELKTPLLVVLGHTGCGAVKAALSGGTDKLSEPIRKELASLKVTKTKRTKSKAKGKSKEAEEEGDPWSDAVLANVNDQVERALSTFAARVNAGQLTIIGAVYDFRNDLGKGAGKVSIVNVNGVTEEARLKAFHDAVLSGADLQSGTERKPMDPFERLSQVFAEHMHDGDDDDDEQPKQIPVPPMQHEPGEIVPAAPAPPPPAGTTMPAKEAGHR